MDQFLSGISSQISFIVRTSSAAIVYHAFALFKVWGMLNPCAGATVVTRKRFPSAPKFLAR